MVALEADRDLVNREGASSLDVGNAVAQVIVEHRPNLVQLVPFLSAERRSLARVGDVEEGLGKYSSR